MLGRSPTRTTTSAHCFCVPSACAKVRRRAHRHEQHRRTRAARRQCVRRPSPPQTARRNRADCSLLPSRLRRPWCHTGPPVTATAHQLDAIAWCYTYTKNEVRSCAPSVCLSLRHTRDLAASACLSDARRRTRSVQPCGAGAWQEGEKKDSRRRRLKLGRAG